MKRNLLENVINFIIRYIWIFCMVLVVLELGSTLYSATLLLQEAASSVLQAQAGEISGRVDGVLRLLNGLAEDEVVGDTGLPLYDRAVQAISYQESYGLYMIAVLDKNFNMIPASAAGPDATPSSRADRDYIQRMAATGTYQITDVIVSRTDGVTKNYTIAVPLFKDGVVDGGIFGSIYLDDIQAMLARESKGSFFLLGRDHTVMVDGESGSQFGRTLQEIYTGRITGGAGLERAGGRTAAGGPGGFWVVSPRGLTYLAYCGVDLTEWTLVYEGRLNSVLPAVAPMLLLKVLLYVGLCWSVARFGRRYLERQLANASHLLDRVTTMQKELFRNEQQGDYEGILELTQQGLSDQLTGISTRSVFIRRFAQCIESGAAQGMLLFLDLDDLKRINDSFGHDAGDRALMHFARVLKEFEAKYGGIAARYGGDEFVLALNGLDEAEGERVADALCCALSATLSVGPDNLPIAIHGSIGAAFYPLHGERLEELISRADLALYIAKHNGKGRYSIYDGQH